MLDKKWFTEAHPEIGIGFSLQIRAQLHQEKSPFQTIAVLETSHFGNLLTLDDVIMLTSRDNFIYHEMITHPILFTHPNPQEIVIIGGGDCGTLKEVLKHPIQTVQQIEIDERVTRVCEKYFPELCTSNHNPRASLLFIDGIHWMQQAPTHSADVIIVDSTDPMGPAEGLFNQAFYQQCHRVLCEDGLFVQQSESPFVHQSLLMEMRTAMKQGGFTDLLTMTFPQPVYPSGWHSVTLAAKQPVLSQFRRDESLWQRLNTRYYHFAMHQAALAPAPFLQELFKLSSF